MVVAAGSREILKQIAVRTEGRVGVTVGSLSTESAKRSGHALLTVSMRRAIIAVLLARSHLLLHGRREE
jgi:hypothetical protein